MFPILAERRTQRAGTMSGGQQQLLAMARALMSRPRLLILDEASLGLSPVAVESVYEAIDQVRAAGRRGAAHRAERAPQPLDRRPRLRARPRPCHLRGTGPHARRRRPAVRGVLRRGPLGRRPPLRPPGPTGPRRTPAALRQPAPSRPYRRSGTPAAVTTKGHPMQTKKSAFAALAASSPWCSRSAPAAPAHSGSGAGRASRSSSGRRCRSPGRSGSSARDPGRLRAGRLGDQRRGRRRRRRQQAPLKLVVKDNKSDPTVVTSAAKSLINDDKAVALLGSVTPPLTIPFSVVADSEQIPAISTLTPTLAWKGANASGWKYSYDVFVDETEQTLANFKASDLVTTNKKVALFTDTEEDGKAMGGLWEKQAPAAGYTVVYRAEFPVGTTDFSQFVQKAKASGAEVMIAQVIPPDAAALWKQMKSLGYAPKTAWPEKGGTTSFPQAVGDSPRARRSSAGGRRERQHRGSGGLRREQGEVRGRPRRAGRRGVVRDGPDPRRRHHPRRQHGRRQGQCRARRDQGPRHRAREDHSSVRTTAASSRRARSSGRARASSPSGPRTSPPAPYRLDRARGRPGLTCPSKPS